MRPVKIALATALLTAITASGYAWADRGHGGHDGHGFRGHGHIGVFIGAPLFWYGYHRPYYPYGDYPFPPVIEAPAPPEYIEQGVAPPPQAYWYYCSNPAGYFPSVKECPSGWQAVAPVPPPKP